MIWKRIYRLKWISALTGLVDIPVFILLTPILFITLYKAVDLLKRLNLKNGHEWRVIIWEEFVKFIKDIPYIILLAVLLLTVVQFYRTFNYYYRRNNKKYPFKEIVLYYFVETLLAIPVLIEFLFHVIISVLTIWRIKQHVLWSAKYWKDLFAEEANGLSTVFDPLHKLIEEDFKFIWDDYTKIVKFILIVIRPIRYPAVFKSIFSSKPKEANFSKFDNNVLQDLAF